ncbi:alkyl hydroperoxide reductase subunit C (plasmid) [Ralstonia solanacearum]|nr:alkyl hydroperoxide reductase subunit C [Ralstonia solanacearum]
MFDRCLVQMVILKHGDAVSRMRQSRGFWSGAGRPAGARRLAAQGERVALGVVPHAGLVGRACGWRARAAREHGKSRRTIEAAD